MTYIILDTETTGLEEKDRLIQVSYVVLDDDYNQFFSETGLFKPGVPINIEAMATNHITEEMVKDQETFSKSKTFTFLDKFLRENGVLVAHNAPFDKKMLEKEGIIVDKYIDTRKVSQHILEESPKHNLQYLRYYLKLDGVDNSRAHDAEGDVEVLKKLFMFFIEEKKLSPEKMIELTNTPVFVKKMPFGKHKDIDMNEIPKDYLRWMKENIKDMDPDLKYTVDKLLE